MRYTSVSSLIAGERSPSTVIYSLNDVAIKITRFKVSSDDRVYRRYRAGVTKIGGGE